MSLSDPAKSTSSLARKNADKMTKYCILPVPLETFSYREYSYIDKNFSYQEYRYSNIRDAVAQAKRDQRSILDDSLPITEATMTDYGIKRTVVDQYDYKGFRYTNIKDAIAQAERDD